MPPAAVHCAAAGEIGPGGDGGDGDGGDGGGSGGCGTELAGSKNPPPFICMMEHTTRFTSVSAVGPVVSVVCFDMVCF